MGVLPPPSCRLQRRTAGRLGAPDRGAVVVGYVRFLQTRRRGEGSRLRQALCFSTLSFAPSWRRCTLSPRDAAPKRHRVLAPLLAQNAEPDFLSSRLGFRRRETA